MKKKKSIIVEYRFIGRDDDIFAFLYSKEWKRWNAYYTEKGANEAMAIHSKKFYWLEYRLKPKGESNGRTD